MATADGGTMQSFQKHIEDMRSLILCKICLNPFYEPYIISCGHTYCYGCLRSWFGKNADRTKTKSCPDCRIVVRTQPAPNYILRDLTHMFIGRAELLSEDETVQEYTKGREEAATELTTDREGPGLFQGVFNRRLPGHLHGPIRDIEDNVDRCPICSWELEDGICAGCGLDIHSSDFDTDDSGDSITIDIPEPPHGIFYGVGSDSDDSSSSDDESNQSGPNEYDHNDDFLDNENEDDIDDMDDGDPASDHGEPYSESHDRPQHAAAFRRHRRIAYSSDESSEDEDVRSTLRSGTHPTSRPAYSAVNLIDDSSTNYDEWSSNSERATTPPRHEAAGSEDQPTMTGSRTRPNTKAGSNRRRPLVIDDDEDEEDEEGDVQSEHASFSSRAATDISAANEEDSDENGTTSRQDSDSESRMSSDSESESEPGAHDDGHESDDSEDSDETIQPPQSRHVRHQRLQNQRVRRTHNNLSRNLPSSRSYAHHGPDERLTQRGQTNRATRVH